MTGSLVIDLGCVAFLPMLVYSLLFWSLDRFEKEPWWLLAGMFAWGAVPAIVITFPVSNWGWTWIHDAAAANELYVMIVAPASEELAKGLALLALLLFFHREIDSVVDGVLYGCLVGFGFSATEDTLYFLAAHSKGGAAAVVKLTILRSYLTGFGHALFASCLGVAVAIACHRKSWTARGVIIGIGFAAAVLLHGVFNSGGTGVLLVMFGGTGGLACVLHTQLKRERAWIVRELDEEVARGVLEKGHYYALISPRKRATALLTTFLRHGMSAWWDLARFYRSATELAFHKRHRRARRDDSLTKPIRELRHSVSHQARKIPHAPRTYARRTRNRL